MTCGECENSIEVRDPYCTGDSWYTVYECRLIDSCPYEPPQEVAKTEDDD